MQEMIAIKEMEKIYQPDIIEKKWAACWAKMDSIRAENNNALSDYSGNAYCTMLPPPNVTGSLHMGHGFQHTLMDILIRYHRMRGFTVLWQGGTDHAGIATQLVVERQLEQKNLSREKLGREKFLEKVWSWKNESGGNITAQMRKIGASIDWTRERFTMDEGFNRAVKTAFIKLYQDNLIYRGKRLVNWDVKLQSAVSDLEVITIEESGSLWHIKYYLDNSQDYIVVATTRPETLFGDIAVAVNPNDSRYQHLIGQQVKLPLTTRKIPVIPDEYVDPEFGTGCVKITPAHDFNDYNIAKRHNLLSEMINILNKNGTLNHLTPYKNIDRLAARLLIINELTAQGHIEKIDPYKINSPRCERTGEIIEPFLTDQWYVSMKPLAKKAIEAVKKGHLKFIPDNWTKTYLQWLENIEDWCISRQLWWGHRIPAYYDPEGNIVVDENAVKSADNLTQDEDVLDTWFSAALWPFATLGWPEKTPELAAFYPTNVLVTGFDIIFFWVARMVMFGLYFTGEVPFREVYITGLIRDQQGQKMSKSKGNVLDPIDLIQGISLEDLLTKRTSGLINPKMASQIIKETQKDFSEGIMAFGADALRFTFSALANTGRDIRFDLGRISGYRNFCNKLWNAARFVLSRLESSIEKSEQLQDLDNIDLSIFDQYILSRLQQVIKAIHHHFVCYRFDLIAQLLYEFVWNDYCDWYLEFSKIKLNKIILVYTLEQIVLLLHPVMPFITEEIFQKIRPDRETMLYESYPVEQTAYYFKAAEKEIGWLKSVIIALRNIRSEMQIAPGKKINVLVYNAAQNDRVLFEAFDAVIKFMVRVESIKETPVIVSGVSATVVNDLQLFIIAGDNINKTAEITRLNKEIQKRLINQEKFRHKLNNADYITKAPSEIVQQEKLRLAENQKQLEALQLQLKNFTA